LGSPPFLERSSRRATEAVVLLLRKLGLPMLGLAFFLFWTFVYLMLWAIHPDEAFKGLDPHPRFADFFYYAVSTAFTSPPEGIGAGSRGQERNHDRVADRRRAPERLRLELRRLAPATRFFRSRLTR